MMCIDALAGHVPDHIYSNGGNDMGDTVRKAIQQGFEELVSEKGYKQTSMQDVCERAHVSKNTLYRYFENKYGIAVSLYEDTINEPMRQFLTLLPTLRQGEAHKLVMIQLFTNFAKHADFWKALARTPKEFPLERLLSSQISASVFPLVAGVEESSEEDRYKAYFMVSGFAKVYLKWIRDGMKQSPEEMGSYFGDWITQTWKIHFTPDYAAWLKNLESAAES